MDEHNNTQNYDHTEELTSDKNHFNKGNGPTVLTSAMNPFTEEGTSVLTNDMNPYNDQSEMGTTILTADMNNFDDSEVGTSILTSNMNSYDNYEEGTSILASNMQPSKKSKEEKSDDFEDIGGTSVLMGKTDPYMREGTDILVTGFEPYIHPGLSKASSTNNHVNKSKSNMKQSTRIIIVCIISFILLAGLGVGAYFLFFNKNNNTEPTKSTESTENQTTVNTETNTTEISTTEINSTENTTTENVTESNTTEVNTETNTEDTTTENNNTEVTTEDKTEKDTTTENSTTKEDAIEPVTGEFYYSEDQWNTVDDIVRNELLVLANMSSSLSKNDVKNLAKSVGAILDEESSMIDVKMYVFKFDHNLSYEEAKNAHDILILNDNIDDAYFNVSSIPDYDSAPGPSMNDSTGQSPE